jgi:polyhydroxyalkanoate synthesis repressor PhaR
MLKIKRYPNRKFYDTEQKRYITLDDIGDRIREGREVQVIDQASREDITSIILTQIIFEQEKRQSGSVPRSILTSLVQAGGYTMGRMRSALSNPIEVLKQIDDEIEYRIEHLIRQGELAEDEARRWRAKLLAGDHETEHTLELEESELQRLLDERGVPTRSELDTLTYQIDQLISRLEAMDEPPESKT